MGRIGHWAAAVRARLGERGVAGIVLAALVAAMVVPLVAMPAVRCEVFGTGCARPPAGSARADAVPVARRPVLAPAEVAARGGYVALGDSYSAGVGAEATLADQNPLDRCHRTSKAYYHAVAGAFAFKGGGFYACSGAKVSNVLHGQAGEPPQIDRVTAGTSLVTISIGGNDVGFARIVAACVKKLPWSRACEDQGGDIAGRLSDLRRALPGLLDKITTRAPRARVVILGYPRVFSEVAGERGDNISIEDQRWLNARALDLNETIRRAAAEADAGVVAAGGAGSVEFVDAYSAFAGHEAGSADPYMNGLTFNLAGLTAEPRSFHPTVKGQEAFARLITAQIVKGPGRPFAG
ncbi:SGNH/GDSL hydrolase family protein [Actinomadura parmotrematis]|uniref:SGNH/GDSL hydrolase family protein n=1 Tax=Actinomadura parmotrematis TaxID=2864039 RepID=A0ABS7FL66_9ACTN|nr:SGNH/GDSL hydrolase family protein [Actinomadura parmotrematis]MBW8481115.1 SGNH/GDSL hydrolase family protein [Actinomadura parmotrematis]